MPTARELLEQADALMRRNRGGDSGIPVLTDRVPDARVEASRRGPSTRAPAAEARAPRSDKARDERMAGSTAVGNAPEASKSASSAGQPSAVAVPHSMEPPVLTDVVEELAVDLKPLPAEQAEGEPSLWLGPDTVDPSLHSITGPAPDTVAVVPPVTLRAAISAQEPARSVDTELPDPTITRTFRAAGSATIPPPAGSAPPEMVPGAPPSAGDENWRALAEQISMQVLQRLDLFIDTGLKEQLAAHLEPIVARAGAELVETINEHVGQLVRSYIAEAIEREIAQWRQEQR